MWGHRIKIRKADKLFSDYIREKANWKCRCCLRDFSNNRSSLEASHYFGRRKESVRFDESNVFAICKGCHFKFHQDREIHKNFVITLIGEHEFARLTIRANTISKRDDKLQIIKIKQLISNLKILKNNEKQKIICNI